MPLNSVSFKLFLKFFSSKMPLVASEVTGARIINSESLERMIKKQVWKWEGKPVCLRQTGWGDLSKVSWRVGPLGLGLLHVFSCPLLSIIMATISSFLNCLNLPKGIPAAQGWGWGEVWEAPRISHLRRFCSHMLNPLLHGHENEGLLKCSAWATSLVSPSSGPASARLTHFHGGPQCSQSSLPPERNYTFLFIHQFIEFWLVGWLIDLTLTELDTVLEVGIRMMSKTGSIPVPLLLIFEWERQTRHCEQTGIETVNSEKCCEGNREGGVEWARAGPRLDGVGNEDLPKEVTVRQTGGWSSQLCDQRRDDFQAEERAVGKTMGQEWVWQPEHWWAKGKVERELAGWNRALEAMGRASDFTQSAVKGHQRIRAER